MLDTKKPSAPPQMKMNVTKKDSRSARLLMRCV